VTPVPLLLIVHHWLLLDSFFLCFLQNQYFLFERMLVSLFYRGSSVSDLVLLGLSVATTSTHAVPSTEITIGKALAVKFEALRLCAFAFYGFLEMRWLYP
jgi:hypothetical protein